MAKAGIQMPEDFLKRISALGDKTDEIVPRVLEAGGEVMLARVKSNLQAVIGKGPESRSTGQMAGALGVSGTRLNREGNHDVKIGFAEPRRDGDANAKIANILEHGKHGQPPRPFLKPAKSTAQDACIEAMKAKMEEEISNILDSRKLITRKGAKHPNWYKWLFAFQEPHRHAASAQGI